MGGKTVVLHPGEGTALWVLGGLYEVLASGEETAGAATIMRMTLPPGVGPPPHTHPGGEAVLILEGAVRYHIDGDVVEGGPGTFFHVPANTLEFFEPIGDTPTKIIVTYTPGGIDEFFAAIGEPAATRELPPPADGPPDFERIVALGAQYGMNIVPPAA